VRDCAVSFPGRRPTSRFNVHVGRSSRVRVLAGMLLLAAGLTVLIDRQGGTKDAVQLATRSWPVAILLVLLTNAATFLRPAFPRPNRLVWPLAALAALIVLFTLVLLNINGAFPTHLNRYQLPTGLIGAGALLVLVARRPDREHQPWIAESAILRRVRLVSKARGVAHVSVQAILGEMDLDLSGATLAGRSELHATAWGARIRLRVPAGWTVQAAPPAGPALEINVPPTPSNLARGQSATLQLHLLGAHGVIQVNWVPPLPKHLVDSD
jgi:hypothetical protein